MNSSIEERWGQWPPLAKQIYELVDDSVGDETLTELVDALVAAWRRRQVRESLNDLPDILRAISGGFRAAEPEDGDPALRALVEGVEAKADELEREMIEDGEFGPALRILSALETAALRDLQRFGIELPRAAHPWVDGVETEAAAKADGLALAFLSGVLATSVHADQLAALVVLQQARRLSQSSARLTEILGGLVRPDDEWLAGDLASYFSHLARAYLIGLDGEVHILARPVVELAVNKSARALSAEPVLSMRKKVDQLVAAGFVDEGVGATIRRIWARGNKAIHETTADIGPASTTIEEVLVVLRALGRTWE